MQFVVLLLLVVALALLVLGLVGTSTPLVIASIVVSLVAVYAAVRARGMRDDRLARRAAEKAQADRIAADKVDADRALAASVPATAAVHSAAARPPVAEPVTTALPSVREPVPEPAAPTDPVPAVELDNAAFGYVGADLAVESLHLPVAEPEAQVEPDPEPVVPVLPRHAVADDATTVLPAVPAEATTVLPVVPADAVGESDEPLAAGTTAPLDVSGTERVWVVDGRPRYHWKSCAFLDFRESEPITLRQAVEDGFTPCALCDPDTRLAF